MFHIFNYGDQPQPHEPASQAPHGHGQSSSALSDTLPAFAYMASQHESMTNPLHLPLQQSLKQHDHADGLSYQSLQSLRQTDDGARSETTNSLDQAHFDHFSSMDSPQDMVASFAQSSHMSSVFSPIMSVPDLPTTLPPLHSGTMNSSNHMDMDISLPSPLEQHGVIKVNPSSRSNRERAPWTPEEDNLLRLAVQLYGHNTEKWAKIAVCVPGRTNKNCRKRWFHSLDPSLRKGTWTDEEDRLLREGVTKYPGQWSKIADMLEGRTDDQCAKRWRESLDPNIDRSDWTVEEDHLLLEKFQTFGSQWQRISQFFDGRPGLHCRNRWRKLQRMVQSKRDKEGLMVATASTYTTLADEPLAPRYRHSHAIESHRPPPDSPDSSTSSPANALLSPSQEDPTVLAQFQTSHASAQSSHYDAHDAHDMPLDEANSDVQPYGCAVDDCDQNYSSSTSLIQHMKSNHPNVHKIERPYRCGMASCPKKYKNLNGLKYHLREAKGNAKHSLSGGGMNVVDERPFVCQIPGCKKRYRTPNGLRYHHTHGHNLAPLPLDNFQSSSLRLRNDKWLLDHIKSRF